MFGRNKVIFYIVLYFVLLGAVFFSCSASFSLTAELDQAKLEIYPSSAFVSIGQTIDFYAEGGEPPYSFEMGDGPGDVDSETGLYTAALFTGSAEVNVVDSGGRICTASVDIVDFQPDVDYELIQFSLTGDMYAGASFEGSFFIHNNGSGIGVVPASWNVYISNDAAVSSDDEEIAHGQIEALSPGVDSAAITFSGSWSATSGSCYVLVSIDSFEDINSANDLYTAIYDIAPVDVDYAMVNNALVLSNSSVISGSAVTESFKLINLGACKGTSLVLWSVYISSDSILQTDIDTLIQYGYITPLSSGETSADIAINQGHWPTSAANENAYLIVNFLASDENPDKLNNNLQTASLAVTPLDIDYQIAAISYNTPYVDVDSSIYESFTYKNAGSDNGISPVDWSAYISLDPDYDSGDQLLESGTLSPLTAGEISGEIVLSAAWPALSGQYYLIIKLINYEDTDNQNNISSSLAFQVSSNVAEPDYYIPLITTLYPVVTTDSIIAESFVIMNLSTTPGNENISWTAYASVDSTFGSDITLGSGVVSVLPDASGSVNQPIYAHWPSVAGEYYLFIQITAADEISEIENNISFAGPFVVYNKPDYSVVINNNDLSLYEICSSRSASDATLTITNETSFAGQVAISWEVFCSDDENYSTDDILFASGGLAPLTPGASAVVSFNGTWPDIGGYHYLIARIYAIDDTNGFNDVYTSRAVALADTIINELENNDALADSLGAGWSSNSDMGITLESGASLVIIANMDAFQGNDVFKFSTGSLVTNLSIKVGWNTGYDDADFQIYSSDDGTVPIVTSGKTHMDFEPASSSDWAVFTELSDYYFNVVFGLENNTSGSEGELYSIMFVAP